MREEREGERLTHVRGCINTRVIWREKMKRPGREDVICDFFGGKLNDRRNDRRDFSPRERERERGASRVIGPGDSPGVLCRSYMRV